MTAEIVTLRVPVFLIESERLCVVPAVTLPKLSDAGLAAKVADSEEGCDVEAVIAEFRAPQPEKSANRTKKKGANNFSCQAEDAISTGREVPGPEQRRG